MSFLKNVLIYKDIKLKTIFTTIWQIHIMREAKSLTRQEKNFEHMFSFQIINPFPVFGVFSLWKELSIDIYILRRYLDNEDSRLHNKFQFY